MDSKFKIGICFMSIGDKYKSMTHWSRQNKINYCNKHGYDFIEDESIYDPEKPIPWSKIPLILKYIDKYDYLVWIDADILIMNLDTKIEYYIDKYPHDFVCGSDWIIPNTGFIIIKNTDFCKEFINYIPTNVYNPNEFENGRYMNWEQGSFINMYDKDFMECRSKNYVCITYPTEMNCYYYNYFPGHFVLHFAGVRGDILEHLIIKHYPERLPWDSDTSYNERMEWLAGPVCIHYKKENS